MTRKKLNITPKQRSELRALADRVDAHPDGAYREVELWQYLPELTVTGFSVVHRPDLPTSISTPDFAPQVRVGRAFMRKCDQTYQINRKTILFDIADGLANRIGQRLCPGALMVAAAMEDFDLAYDREHKAIVSINATIESIRSALRSFVRGQPVSP